MRTKTPKAPAISEAQFQRTVIEAARRLGWLVHHVRPGRNARGRWMTAVSGDVGFPDLVLVHEGTGDVIFAELKRDDGKLEPAQERWARALDVELRAVWRPKDWPAIEGRLKHPEDMSQKFCGHI